MRILFDSKKLVYKDPFGCVAPGQACRLAIKIPATVKASAAQVCVQAENGQPVQEFSMEYKQADGPYEIWQAEISLDCCGLYFYYFRITGHTGAFRLFKYGDDTNMEDGDLWQLSCIDHGFVTPDWAKGAVIYQLFPDRFYKSGNCDLTGKLEPYTVHENWNEEVDWRPNEKGEVLNNDFFGGNFRGITEKMDYIADLGVDILYLNPIGKAFSSHRYDTGDYKTPDPMLGTVEDFRQLCQAAHERNIKVVLDGVYSHTGCDSLYFNKMGSFDSVGAYQSKDSAYYSWYQFRQFPDKYVSWWDFDTLPTVNKMDPSFMDYIIYSEDSVVAHWLSLGADGFRLDVADELPDAFILALKNRIRQLRPDALLMGEIWEDASNKIAYGIRRKYFVDGELDSIMNYPYRTAILNFLRRCDDGRALKNAVMTVLENYPPQVALCNMNMLGTHDTPRILTALVDDFDGDRHALASRKLSQEQLSLAVARLKTASALQFCLPGAPSIYYGDEALMEGHKDPFNRRTYPWGAENQALLSHFKALGALRKNHPALKLGSTEFVSAGEGFVHFVRRYQKSAIHVCLSNGAPVAAREHALLQGETFCIWEENQ